MSNPLVFLPQFSPIVSVTLTALMFILGAALGSFACCQAWRLRLMEQNKRLGARSVCLHCKYQLKWYDNIPIFSWLILGGRCRKCKKPIGKAEILAEFSLGIVFALIGLNFFAVGTASNLDLLALTKFMLLLAVLVAFWVLLIYDARWRLLPTKVLVVAIVLALAYAVVVLISTPASWNDVINLLGSIALLAGIYFLLYFFSNESMVGGGDWLLCLAIALILGHWWLAIIELFLANLFAAIASLPAFIKKGQKQLAFGPFLIVAFVLIYLTQAWLMLFMQF